LSIGVDFFGFGKTVNTHSGGRSRRLWNGRQRAEVDDSIGLDEDVAFRSDPELRAVPARNDWLVDAVPLDCKCKRLVAEDDAQWFNERIP
jgi:hypothetical protein